MPDADDGAPRVRLPSPAASPGRGFPGRVPTASDHAPDGCDATVPSEVARGPEWLTPQSSPIPVFSTQYDYLKHEETMAVVSSLAEHSSYATATPASMPRSYTPPFDHGPGSPSLPSLRSLLRDDAQDAMPSDAASSAAFPQPNITVAAIFSNCTAVPLY